MSDLTEKLRPDERGIPGAARSTLRHLLARWGELAKLSDGRIRITSMGGVTWWRCVTGRPDAADSIYERTDEPHEGEAHGEG